MKVVGITGKKRAGKDTFATLLGAAYRAQHGDQVRVERLAFADALKREICAVLGITLEALEADKEFYRPVLQWWGTEWRRGKHGADYWVRLLRYRIERSPADLVLVPDVRFGDEAELIHALGGVVVRVEKLGQDSADAHASENAMNDYEPDMVVQAFDGDFATLQTLAGNLARHLN